MSLNHKEIDIVLSELDLKGAFVQDIVQPNFDSIAFYTFKPGAPKTVFVSLASGACRISETRRKITKNEKPLRFNELLKSKIKGARILSIRQIDEERIIKIELEKAGTVFVMPKAQEKFAKKAKNREEENAKDEKFTIFIRLWSNAANIFLCGESNEIIDCFFRRPAKNEIAGGTFVLPEKKEKTRVFEARDFAETEAKIKENLQERGINREISYSEKIDAFYSENAAQTSLESLLAQAEKWYETHKVRLLSALNRLEEKRDSFKNAEKFKHFGDLILAYSYKIEESSNFIECDDWISGEAVKVKIDSKKSAQENAQNYYEQYKKAQSGLESLEHDILMTKKELDSLSKKYETLKNEKNPIRLEQLLRKTQTPKQQEKKSHAGLDYEIGGWRIIVGRTADENDDLLRHTVRGSDWWLHVRDWQGGYVFIKNQAGKTVPLEILLYAGNLAVYFSKARKNGSADLYYTQVKHLRRAKNAPKGTVLPSNEKNLFIKLDEEKLRKLEEMQID